MTYLGWEEEVQKIQVRLSIWRGELWVWTRDITLSHVTEWTRPCSHGNRALVSGVEESPLPEPCSPTEHMRGWNVWLVWLILSQLLTTHSEKNLVQLIDGLNWLKYHLSDNWLHVFCLNLKTTWPKSMGVEVCLTSSLIPTSPPFNKCYYLFSVIQSMILMK